MLQPSDSTIARPLCIKYWARSLRHKCWYGGKCIFQLDDNIIFELGATETTTITTTTTSCSIELSSGMLITWTRLREDIAGQKSNYISPIAKFDRPVLGTKYKLKDLATSRTHPNCDTPNGLIGTVDVRQSFQNLVIASS